MDEYFLQELNAITAYANNSNTLTTEENVRAMLTKLLKMKPHELYGDRPYPFCIGEANTEELENDATEFRSKSKVNSVRPKEVIENEIKELESKLKFDEFRIPAISYTPEYDKNGNLVGFRMDPEQAEILDKLKELEHELLVNYPPDPEEYGGLCGR